MRCAVAVVAICISTVGAFGAEAYLETGKLLGSCLGQELRNAGGSHASADVMDAFLQLKCGFLEEQQEKEFFDFLRERLARPLNDKQRAELGIAIVGEVLTSHTRGGGRRMAIEAYKSVILKQK
jgi:hypothetical protein